MKTAAAHHWKEFGADMRENHGWTVKQVAQFGLAQDRLARRLAKDRKKMEVAEVPSSPRPTQLDHLYKFDKPPRRRLYEKGG